MATKKAKWKPGDIVRLKSGGPAMTVDAVHDGEPIAIRCAYFYGYVDARFVNVDAESLEAARPGEGF